MTERYCKAQSSYQMDSEAVLESRNLRQHSQMDSWQTVFVFAQSCSEPAAGILIYAPAASERGASLDSRMLYSHTNTTTCLDANASPCMVFSW